MKGFTTTILYFSLILLVFSCKGNEDTNEISNSLESYISEHNVLIPLNELVACAAGGQKGFLDDQVFSLSVFFYPELEATDFKYYETNTIEVDPLDLKSYQEVKSDSEPLFNGFLRRFILPKRDKEVWARVSFIANDTLWYSKAIRIKEVTQPTEFAPDLCEINQSQSLEPVFTWKDGKSNDNFIYFHVISDSESNALSGTYTNEKRFQYYKTDNVVFNVTREGQVKPLNKDNKYIFTLMGVSEDNWVNLIMQKEFIAE